MTGQKILGKLYKSGIGCGDILSILYFKLKIFKARFVLSSPQRCSTF
jgi:hypothetical protein